MTVQVKPEAFLIAETKLVADQTDAFLAKIGAPGWTTDAMGAEALIEIAGRACYRSFGVGLNKNVTRVREGNRNYIGNSILKAGHGSVLEHATVTIAFTDVSRIVTHELVRHRAGVAVSQESGRFIRIDTLRYYMPEVFGNDALREVYDALVAAGQVPQHEIAKVAPDGIGFELTKQPQDFEEWADEAREKFGEAMAVSEEKVAQMEHFFGLDVLPDFGTKKKLQSAIRRAAPNGMANVIIVTANHRAWRHITDMRTSGHAEEEIRLAQFQAFELLAERYPNIYQDATCKFDPSFLPRGVPAVVFANPKV